MSSWFKKLFTKEVSIPDASFVEKCEENPTGARAYLAADQAQIAKEIEEMFAAYDARLASLASRVKTLSEDELAREMESIRDAQDDLRRVVRRFQAALKSTEDLDRELDGWSNHPGIEGELHADHPLVRSEIARSELASRDREELERVFVDSRDDSMGKISLKNDFVEPKILDEASPTEQYQVIVHDVDPRMIMDEANLIAAIRDAAREAAKWRGIPNEEHTQDAIDQVKQYKQLTAILKRLDQERGIKRDRSIFFP